MTSERLHHGALFALVLLVLVVLWLIGILGHHEAVAISR
jgi:hypothetical protein